jgi:hypothetical protein
MFTNRKLTKIVSVETTGKITDTFDIEVESELHAFTAKHHASNSIGISHNSALISLSNLSDERMRNAKNGQWWEEYVHRALANNSVAYTEKPEIGIFMKEWLSLYDSKSGERGIFNRVAATKQAKKTGRREIDGIELGLNPCSEILLRSKEFCNLSEVIVRNGDTLEQLCEKVRIATIIGTFQSTLTDFRYLRHIWKQNCDEERLLGVSLTGIMDHIVLSGREGHDKMAEWADKMRETAIKVNKEWATKLGVNQSVSLSSIKPSGCRTVDSNIKTTLGDKNFIELMAIAGYDFDDFNNQEKVWIIPNDLEEMPKVYDENNELQDITKLYINGISPVIEIEFEDGKKHSFTPNHKLMTINGWKRVDELTLDDEITTY